MNFVILTSKGNTNISRFHALKERGISDISMIFVSRHESSSRACASCERGTRSPRNQRRGPVIACAIWTRRSCKRVGRKAQQKKNGEMNAESGRVPGGGCRPCTILPLRTSLMAFSAVIMAPKLATPWARDTRNFFQF